MSARDPAAAWCVHGRAGVGWIGCAALAEIPGVAHAFFTRRGPGSTDLDSSGDGPAIEARLGVALDAAGLTGPPVLLHQVHGSVVHQVGAWASAAEPPLGDGLVALDADRPLGALAVRSADCVPLLFAERGGRAVAAAHAGWRGVVAGTAAAVVLCLRTLGIRPAELVVALGPAIGPCCYEVGADVLGAVAAAGGGRVERARSGPLRSGRLDLHAALRGQLGSAGVPERAIRAAPWCTRCTPELFFSYRREGLRSGRQLACIGWTPRGVP